MGTGLSSQTGLLIIRPGHTWELHVAPGVWRGGGKRRGEPRAAGSWQIAPDHSLVATCHLSEKVLRFPFGGSPFSSHLASVSI